MATEGLLVVLNKMIVSGNVPRDPETGMVLSPLEQQLEVQKRLERIANRQHSASPAVSGGLPRQGNWWS